MISATLMGGLGNQLFQLAAAHGLAIQSGKETVIQTQTAGNSAHSRNDYKHTIFKNWRQVDTGFDYIFKEAEHDACVHTVIAVPETSAHFHMHGYFQHEKYVADCRAEFIDRLSLPADVPHLRQSCFIHIRKGDYVGNAVHDIDLCSRYLPRAMSLLRALHPGLSFLVFSDDIAFCKTMALLQQDDVLFYEEADEVASLVQMSKCGLGGICWNSSFSWWGAYMNENPDKVVVFPSKWFNNSWKVDIQLTNSIIIKT